MDIFFGPPDNRGVTLLDGVVIDHGQGEFQCAAEANASCKQQMKTISLSDAVGMIPHGATLMIGGFMGHA